MPRKIEPLNGGLVTDRDGSQLKPGQLSAMRNLVYLNGSTSLVRASGRGAFGTVSATATGVNGLRDIAFDNGDRYLIAMAGDKYRTASPTGFTGTFSTLATITAGTSLEVVHYRNRFFLMNGASADASSIGTNLVVYLSATATGGTLQTRQHGMFPVESAPKVATAAGSFSQSVTGYYEYWTTEVARLRQDDATVTLESAFSSDNGVSTVFISSTGQAPNIQLPIVKNSITTHWRIYRSPKKDAAADKKFPSGFMIAELATGASAHIDSAATASASAFPANVNSAGYYFGFASASSMFSDNGVYASGTVAPITVQSTQQGVYGFNLGGFTGSVKGIKVEVEGYVSAGAAPVPIQVTIGRRRASDGRFLFGDVKVLFDSPGFASKTGLLTSTNSAAPTLLTLGSDTDRWVATDKPGFVDTDFDTTFMVVITTGKLNTSIGIDFVRVTVYYSASVDGTVPFPSVVYTFGDIVSQVAKNFPPPSSSTGDLYQDSLVVNDVSNTSLVRYSFAGEPESFPPTYYIDFQTRDNDRVTYIRVVNNRLVIGLANSVWRANYLPSERDSNFDRGKAIEIISRDYGVVNPMAACTFTVDGEAEQLAFVSQKGIHTTDGFNFITRSKNLNWRKIIPVASSGTAIIALLNDPENRCLRLFYRNDLDTDFPNESYLCLFASYDRADIDAEGNLKFSGPVHMRNFDSGSGAFASVESAWALQKSDGLTGFFIGYGGTATAAGAGKVYSEKGTTIPSEYAGVTYTTRRLYLSGLTGEWTVDDLYGYCGSYSGGPVLTYTFKDAKTNGALTTLGSKSVSLPVGGSGLHRMNPKFSVEGPTITMESTDAATFAQEYLIIGSKDLGLEESGK